MMKFALAVLIAATAITGVGCDNSTVASSPTPRASGGRCSSCRCRAHGHETR